MYIWVSFIKDSNSVELNVCLHRPHRCRGIFCLILKSDFCFLAAWSFFFYLYINCVTMALQCIVQEGCLSCSIELYFCGGCTIWDELELCCVHSHGLIFNHIQPAQLQCIFNKCVVLNEATSYVIFYIIQYGMIGTHISLHSFHREFTRSQFNIILPDMYRSP